MHWVEVTFWVSIGLVAYAYAGFPLLLALAARLSRTAAGKRDPHQDEPRDWPFVSLIISAYKEERFILQRLHNALRMDYPADRLEILIGCDGNEDATGELVRTVNDSRVRLLQFPERRGKPSVLNDCVAAAQGDVLAFSDANTFWGPDALKKLVQRLDDARVGGVCGQLILTDPQTGANIDGAYWKYENFLKHCEGAIGALLGFNGAIYVLRRACWQALPPQTIVDDFLIGMRVYLCGRTLAFEESALAHEESAPSLKAEFHRRARIGAGGFQSLVWLLPLLSPRYGRLAWAFWSHKLLRWCCPLFLAAAFAANVALSRQTPYGWLLVAQASFYGLAFAGRELRSAGPAAKGLKLASMFVGMNAALAVGFWRWAARQQSGAWRRTERSLEAPARGELTRV